MKTNDEELKIWELYEIHPSMERPLKLYGYWSLSKGLRSDEPSKLVRRKNLQVTIRLVSILIFFCPKCSIFQGVKLVVQARTAAYFLSASTPIQDKPGEFEISGLFADVWPILKVIKYYTLLCDMSSYKVPLRNN